MDYQKILKGIHQEIEPYATIGKQADYIPALAKINPDQFGMCIHTIQGQKPSWHGEATTGLLHTKYFESIFPCHVPKP